MPTPEELKSYVLLCMEQFQDHQKELARLTTSLDAAIETLKAENPDFGAAYTSRIEDSEQHPYAIEADGVIRHINAAIRGLRESK